MAWLTFPRKRSQKSRVPQLTSHHKMILPEWLFCCCCCYCCYCYCFLIFYLSFSTIFYPQLRGSFGRVKACLHYLSDNFVPILSKFCTDFYLVISSSESHWDVHITINEWICDLSNIGIFTLCHSWCLTLGQEVFRCVFLICGIPGVNFQISGQLHLTKGYNVHTKLYPIKTSLCLKAQQTIPNNHKTYFCNIFQSSYSVYMLNGAC